MIADNSAHLDICSLPPEQRLKYDPVSRISYGDNHELRSRHSRARIFAEWIIQKFFTGKGNNEKALSKTIIYDVAGGKGEIGFELGIRQRNSIGNDYRYIVVDPRKPDKFETGALPKWQRKMIKVHKY